MTTIAATGTATTVLCPACKSLDRLCPACEMRHQLDSLVGVAGDAGRAHFEAAVEGRDVPEDQLIDALDSLAAYTGDCYAGLDEVLRLAMNVFVHAAARR